MFGVDAIIIFWRGVLSKRYQTHVERQKQETLGGISGGTLGGTLGGISGGIFGGTCGGILGSIVFRAAFRTTFWAAQT